MAVESKIVEISPQEALRMLDQNEGNRNVRQTRVEMYARDMKRGEWKLNGIPIILNGKRVMDGQHRLHACVRANKPFRTALVTGVTPDSHRTIDTGLSRTMADELRWAGETNVAELAAVLNLVWRLDEGMIADPSLVPSRAELVALLKRRPEIRESLKAIPVGKHLKIRGTALATCHHLILREHLSAQADAFLAHLDAGTDYVQGDPCLALRGYATFISGNKSWRPTTVEWLAYCIKAANAWLLGHELKSIRWRRIGPKREGFPTIATAEEVGDEIDE